MKERGGADALRLALEVGTAGKLDGFELLDAGEMPVDQARVGQQPEMFSGLEFGGVRREKQQMDVVGHLQTDTGVPAGPIQHQDNLLVGTSTRLARELGPARLQRRGC